MNMDVEKIYKLVAKHFNEMEFSAETNSESDAITATILLMAIDLSVHKIGFDSTKSHVHGIFNTIEEGSKKSRYFSTKTMGRG